MRERGHLLYSATYERDAVHLKGSSFEMDRIVFAAAKPGIPLPTLLTHFFFATITIFFRLTFTAPLPMQINMKSPKLFEGKITCISFEVLTVRETGKYRSPVFKLFQFVKQTDRKAITYQSSKSETLTICKSSVINSQFAITFRRPSGGYFLFPTSVSRQSREYYTGFNSSFHRF